MSKIRVLSVDDSALMRQIMTEIINSHSDMEMVATAPDPLVARDLIKKYNPDVLTLDVEMPRMDGIDFLEKLMRLRPMPVVMVSSLTGKPEGRAVTQLGKVAGHWGVNRRNRGNSPCTPAIAALKPGYSDHATYAAGLYPLVRGAPE